MDMNTWPTDDLVKALRGLHAIPANQAADVLAAVVAALDRYDGERRSHAAYECVQAVAKAVGR